MLTLYQFNNLQIFFQYSRLLSLFFYLFLFLCKIFLCLVRSHLFIVGFVSFNLGDRTKKMLLQLMIVTVLPMFYFRNFMIPSFIFFYLTHLSLFLYMMWENVPISFFFIHSCPIFPASLMKETIFPPLFILGSFVIEYIKIDMSLFLRSIFCSSDLCASFCASIILFWLL